MRASKLLSPCVDITELAQMTTNYSGAEIKGAVGAAQSHALGRYLANIDTGKQSGENGDSGEQDVQKVTMADFTNRRFSTSTPQRCARASCCHPASISPS